jgi:hyperosmotically inducible protein
MKKLVRTFSSQLLLSLFSLALTFSMGSDLFAATKANNPVPRDTAHYQAWLTNEVRRQLVMLPWYSVFDNLEYKVDGSEVTLLGQVVNPTLKFDAENAVKHIEGVTRVVNDIEILPPSPMDYRIRRAEYRAIFGEPALERYAMGAVPPIHIVVKGGHVTLEGVVATQFDKDLANMRANEVPGIFSVTNNLRVEFVSKQ